MTTYPLATLSVTVTDTGITAPSYNDILLSLQASYQAIYGSDVSLDPSTQDGEWGAIQAAAINDSNQAAIAVYNTFSPSTAVGAGLSSVVKVNGIQRLIPSASTAAVLITGQAGTTITNGQVADNAGLNTLWALPTTVNIPPGGTITVTATCTTEGAVAAAPATLTVISTPTAGWQLVNNVAAAALGAPVETDSQLRIRQTRSTALPSETVLAGIIGAIGNLPGVTGVSFSENDTGSTNSDGVPEHAISMVVEGGTVQDIVDIIGSRKTIGCNTYGNTSGTYVDPTYGFPYTIFFSIPTQKTIVMTITITALTGYTTAIGLEIKAALVAYITALGIGADVLITRLYAPALLQGPYATVANPNDPFTYELTSVLAAISPGSPGSSDLVIAYDQIPVCAAVNITLVVV